MADFDAIVKGLQAIKDFGSLGWLAVSLYAFYRIGHAVLLQVNCLRRSVIFYLALRRRQVIAIERAISKIDSIFHE